MQLGTQTASLMNHLMSRSTNGAPEPEVGMGATILGWTDRHAATVISWDGKILRVQRDKATRIDTLGMTDAQGYEYERDPEGCVYDYKRDRSGKWREVASDLAEVLRDVLTYGLRPEVVREAEKVLARVEGR